MARPNSIPPSFPSTLPTESRRKFICQKRGKGRKERKWEKEKEGGKEEEEEEEERGAFGESEGTPLNQSSFRNREAERKGERPREGAGG